jgi:hypothetical protein
LIAGTLSGALAIARATVSTHQRQFTLHVDQGLAPEIAGRRIGTFRQAVAVFGRPAIVAPETAARPSCRASWPELGLAIEFSARFASCKTTELGGWLTVTATAKRWHTRVGLHVGDPEAKLHRLYPQAPRLDFLRQVPTWQLETGGLYCDGGPTLTLAAVVSTSRITSLIATHVPACG